MFGSPRIAINPVLWLVFTLLFILAPAVPARASIDNLELEAGNPTIYVRSNYTLTFSATGDISVGDVVYVDVHADFDCSEINLDDVRLMFGGNEYDGAVGINNNNEFSLPVEEFISAGTEVSVLIPDIINPSRAGMYDFASVGIDNSYSQAEAAKVEISNPKLIITPEYNTIDVNLRNKITLSLKDFIDGEFVTPVDAKCFILDPDSGDFFTQPEGVLPLTAGDDGYIEYEIPKRSSSTEIYYRPTEAGEHKVSAYVGFGDSTSTPLFSSDPITVNPANVTYIGIEPVNGDKFTAGEPGLLMISARNQYDEKQPVENEVTVELIAKNGDGNPVGKFLQADEQGNVTGEEINSVVIPPGKHSVPVYFRSDVGKYNQHEVYGEYGYLLMVCARVGNRDFNYQIEVFPAAAKKLVVKPVDKEAGLVNEVLTFKVELHDEYGNLAKPQPAPLTVNLKTSSATGSFWTNDNPVTQVTFSEYWWDKEENETIFDYMDSEPNEEVFIWAEATYLDLEKAEIKILPAPASVTVTPADTDWLVNQRGKITINLQDASGQAYQVPGEITDGLNVLIETTAAGSFFDALVGGNELSPEQNGILVNIPAGRDHIDLFYAPAAGTNEITASLPGVEDASPGRAGINASPASGVTAVLSKELNPEDIQIKLSFVAGQAGKVYVAVVDQENNLVTQDEDLTVYLRAVNKQGTSAGEPYVPSQTGHFFGAGVDFDANGKPLGEPINEIVIPQGEEAAEVYYYDTRTTGDDYALYLETCTTPVYSNYFQATIEPAAAEKLSVKIFGHPYYSNNPQIAGADISIANSYGYDWQIKGRQGPVTELVSDRRFPMEISIVDRNGNPVEQTSELTVNLSATGENVAGSFLEFDSATSTFKPVSQITFRCGESTKTLHFEGHGKGALNIVASAPGLTAETHTVDMGMRDRLAIHFPLTEQFEEIEDNYVAPGERQRFVVLLTDANGNPHYTVQDITVNLSGAVFYTDESSGEAITSITIPAGYHGVQVFVEGPEEEGIIKINAQTSTEGIGNSPEITVNVALQKYFSYALKRGWNTLSTPIALERTALDQIIIVSDNIFRAFTYDGVQGKWLQVYKHTDNKWYLEGDDSNEFALKPQEALFVEMEGDSPIIFYASRELTTPPTRTLAPGWNLISPSITEYVMEVNEVLSSIEGKYSQVVSPGVGWQPSWSYVPGSTKDKPYMQMGYGYWVYMQEAGTLAGFSSTPVREYH